jgi:hypothetical protein
MLDKLGLKYLQVALELLTDWPKNTEISENISVAFENFVGKNDEKSGKVGEVGGKMSAISSFFSFS